MKRIYYLLGFSLILVTLTVEAKLSTTVEHIQIWSDPPSDNMKKYMIKMAVSDGLDKNAIKIETDSWGDVILSDTWRTIKFKRGSWGEYTTVNKDDVKITIKEDFSGNIVVKDEGDDRSPSTVFKNIHDNLEIRDEKGNVKTVSKNIFGGLEIRDNNGNRASVKKDIFGKITIDDPKGILNEVVKLQLIEELSKN
ncbi:hypothetical protein [Sphingobacterium sp.]|uniref:hypothetical protein n=1 Tax=Sphingobacterium sp. TaxID=341027 RepID=UPI002FDC92E8